MKNFIIFLIFVFALSTLQAQGVINLDPATVTSSSPKILIYSNLDRTNFEIKESYKNQFLNNPIKFVEENFKLSSFDLQDVENAEVRFICSKGYLKALYNKKGELIKTEQRFRDIALPARVWRDIYKENIGWTMASNLYTANGKGNRIHTELYKVKLTLGKQKKYVKFVPQQIEGGRVAGF